MSEIISKQPIKIAACRYDFIFTGSDMDSAESAIIHEVLFGFIQNSVLTHFTAAKLVNSRYEIKKCEITISIGDDSYKASKNPKESWIRFKEDGFGNLFSVHPFLIDSKNIPRFNPDYVSPGIVEFRSREKQGETTIFKSLKQKPKPDDANAIVFELEAKFSPENFDFEFVQK